MGNFLKNFLTVEIWNLNLKKWPLENRKNNGPIDLKTLGYDWSWIVIFLISDLKIKIYRTILKYSSCANNGFFEDVHTSLNTSDGDKAHGSAHSCCVDKALFRHLSLAVDENHMDEKSETKELSRQLKQQDNRWRQWVWWLRQDVSGRHAAALTIANVPARPRKSDMHCSGDGW